MHARLVFCISLHMTAEMPSITDSKDIIGSQKWKNRPS